MQVYVDLTAEDFMDKIGDTLTTEIIAIIHHTTHTTEEEEQPTLTEMQLIEEVITYQEELQETIQDTQTRALQEETLELLDQQETVVIILEQHEILEQLVPQEITTKYDLQLHDLQIVEQEVQLIHDHLQAEELL